MNCQDVLGEIELCALGTLEPDEAAPIHTHAATCEDCCASLFVAEDTAAWLALSVPLTRAPKAMRVAVIDAVRAPAVVETSRPRSFAARLRLVKNRRIRAQVGALAAAVVLIPLAAALVWVALLQREVNDLRRDTAQVQRRNDGLVLFAVPSSIKADFRPVTENIVASGAASWNPDRGRCYVMFDRLPQAEAGAVYRLWYVVDSGRLIDAGAIMPDDVGWADAEVDASRWRGRNYDMVLRLERRPHDPEAQPILTAQLRRGD